MPPRCRTNVSPQKKPRRRYNQALKRAMVTVLRSASTRDLQAATGIPKSNLARWAQQSGKLQSFDGSGKRFNLDGAGRPEEIPDTAALKAFMVMLREAKRAEQYQWLPIPSQAPPKVLRSSRIFASEAVAFQDNSGRPMLSKNELGWILESGPFDNFDPHVSKEGMKIASEEAGCVVAAIPPNATSTVPSGCRDYGPAETSFA
ncbi:hypothetical protein H310_12307 [Aphanomyces invadans]|uniref:Uncharacterized protein n=1 Tax=Aphanomyces invadans TaxID=157072 RepID=A0A024TJE0_9STRA|nr:hypothetical protein H310_12307 [Aphanomyces invadans]ETV93731.1 hypothetical protein H310_12307 [Aphanomyces invadans]|eukprot:XP_008877540.1 hypothetical protein H310_12307 [Aphanomyces invadans]